MLQSWGFAILIGIGFFALARFVLQQGVKQLKGLASKTGSNWDDLLIETLTKPLQILNVFASISVAIQFSPEIVSLHKSHQLIFKLAVVCWMNWVLWRISHAILKSDLVAHWNEEAKNLVILVLRTLIICIAVLAAAESLGLSITPILASLGIGSLAIALALQDTLTNFFGGIYLLIDKPVRVGDYVKIDDNTEGNIVKIGWRSTWIRLSTNNLVVIPNSKLLANQVTNFSLLDSKCFLNLPLGVSYDSDLSKVEALLIDIATAVQIANDAMTDEAPLVRFKAFGESSVDLVLVVKIKDISQLGIIRHHLIKTIHMKFSENNIDIPFPTRNVFVKGQAGLTSQIGTGPSIPPPFRN